jgi:hypothetical protein
MSCCGETTDQAALLHCILCAVQDLGGVIGGSVLVPVVAPTSESDVTMFPDPLNLPTFAIIVEPGPVNLVHVWAGSWQSINSFSPT